MNEKNKNDKLYTVIGLVIGAVIFFVLVLILSYFKGKNESLKNDYNNSNIQKEEVDEQYNNEEDLIIIESDENNDNVEEITKEEELDEETTTNEDITKKEETTKKKTTITKTTKKTTTKKQTTTTKKDENKSGAKYSYDLSKLYWTNLNKQAKPRKLLVIIFNYKGNPYYTDSNSVVEKAWADYIFGSGSIKNNDASINDYLKEISNGKFYFEPVLLGNNKTGVYTVNLNKSYSDEQGLHYNFPFHEFTYDIATAMDSFKNKGLNINSFKANGINNSNFSNVLSEWFDANQSFRNPQWYDTNNIMAIFPPINREHLDFTPLSTNIDSFGLYAHINYDTSFGTIAHELLHTTGTIDIYNFGDYGSDIMSSYYPYIEHDYNTVHINPYYKILFGWTNTKILENSATVTLYPATSKKYNPIIVKTKDNNQYYIIENRKAESFDHGITIDSSEGINIWRVDKLGMEKIYHSKRKGLSVDKLTFKNKKIELKYYKNYTNVNDNTEVLSGVKVQFINKNSDGSIEVKIEQ